PHCTHNCCHSSFRLSVLTVCFRTQPPPRPTLFPYTTLFRSVKAGADVLFVDINADAGAALESELDSAGHPGRAAFRHVDISDDRSEEHTSELQSRFDIVCRLLLEKKNTRHLTTRNRNNKHIN